MVLGFEGPWHRGVLLNTFNHLLNCNTFEHWFSFPEKTRFASWKSHMSRKNQSSWIKPGKGKVGRMKLHLISFSLHSLCLLCQRTAYQPASSALFPHPSWLYSHFYDPNSNPKSSFLRGLWCLWVVTHLQQSRLPVGWWPQSWGHPVLQQMDLNWGSLDVSPRQELGMGSSCRSSLVWSFLEDTHSFTKQ